MFSPTAKFVHGTPLEVDYTPAAAVAAGQVVNVNNLLGYAHRDIAANQLGALSLGGCVYDVINDGSAFTDRVPVYFNVTTQQCTISSIGTRWIGFAIGAVGASTAGTATTRVFVSLPTLEEFDTNNIADPGNAGTIPSAVSGNVNLVSAGAETRSVAAPSYVGQELLLSAATIVGTITVGFPAAFDTTPHAHIAFTAAGQSAIFVATDKSGTPTWVLSSNNGATPSA